MTISKRQTGGLRNLKHDITLSVRCEPCSGGKKSKDRLTVCLCVNMEGEFEKPLVIGKSENPDARRMLTKTRFLSCGDLTKKPG